MTRVLCCYTETNLHPKTRSYLSAYAPETEFVKVEYGDNYGYWNALTAKWGQETLINIEQDMVPLVDTISSLKECPEPWCVYGYKVKSYQVLEFIDQNKELAAQVRDDGWCNMGLGCVKFSEELQQLATVQVLRRVMDVCEDCHGSWFHMDVHFARLLVLMGFRPHVHGDIEHAHPYGECKCGCGFVTYKTNDHVVHTWTAVLGSYDLEDEDSRQKMIDAFHRMVEERDESDTPMIRLGYGHPPK